MLFGDMAFTVGNNIMFSFLLDCIDMVLLDGCWYYGYRTLLLGLRGCRRDSQIKRWRSS